MKSKKIKAVKKLCILALGIFLSLTFLSCKSLPKKHEPVNLTIFIIDEKDQPVQDYEICLGGRGQTACSNKNGLCIFYDCKLYEYSISGKKSGYTQILQNQACLEKTSELFCYRVLSAAYVLDQAEALFEKGEYQKALELLDRLCLQ